MSKSKDVLIPLLVAAGLHAILWVGAGWLYSDALSDIQPGDGWVTISMPWVDLLHTFMPGLVAGYLCRHSPLLIGFTAVALASLAMFPMSWHPVVGAQDPPLLVQAVDSAFRSGIAGAVAAAAGFLLARRLGANNSSKPTPLRGAA